MFASSVVDEDLLRRLSCRSVSGGGSVGVRGLVPLPLEQVMEALGPAVRPAVRRRHIDGPRVPAYPLLAPGCAYRVRSDLRGCFVMTSCIRHGY